MTKEKAVKYPINKIVVVRSSQSGVWFGKLTAAEQCSGDGLATCQMKDARRIHYWEGAGSCSGLAAKGPRAGRIAAAVDATVFGVCEILVATPTAKSAVDGIAVWNP